MGFPLDDMASGGGGGWTTCSCQRFLGQGQSGKALDIQALLSVYDTLMWSLISDAVQVNTRNARRPIDHPSSQKQATLLCIIPDYEPKGIRCQICRSNDD